MSSPTGPAAAPGLPAPSRRALLAGALVLPIAALPSPVAGALGHPDAALFALEPSIHAAHAAWDAALAVQTSAQRRYFAAKPKRPERPSGPRPPFEDGDTVGDLRAWIRGETLGRREAQALYAQSEAAYARADRAARKASGVVAAERAERLASRAYEAAMAEALAIRPTTLDGLLFKATLPGLDEHDPEACRVILADLRAFAQAGGHFHA